MTPISRPTIAQSAAALDTLQPSEGRSPAKLRDPAAAPAFDGIKTGQARRRVALIGAGNIADAHAQVLTESALVDLVAIVDPVTARAEALARKWRIAGAFGSLQAALAAGSFDAAHVVVPPPLHRRVAEECLAAGLDVFVEKPMAETDADCAALQEAAKAAGVALRVNQNSIYHPAQLELKRIATEGTLGRLRHVSCHFNMPLAHMRARQFGHWMFQEPRNLLLEQAVHPMSQIDDLMGPVKDFSVTPAPPQMIDGLALHTTWLVSMLCERGTAELFVSIGQTFPVWSMTALFDDGAVTADYAQNRVVRQGASRWMEAFDSYSSGAGAAWQMWRQTHRNLFDYALSMFKLKPRSDAFYRGMHGSIHSFYEALARGDQAALDGAQGRRLVALCEAICEKAGAVPGPKRNANAPSGAYDVLVIGGTGFIGRPLVAALLKEGKRVAVLARNSANLPPLFQDPNVAVIRGDATNAADLDAALTGIKAVVNLAYSRTDQTWAEVEQGIVGGARTVAEACLRHGVERLIYASTIAALYLGDEDAVVTGETPPDPNAERRPFYSRAKAYAEHEMRRMHREQGLPVTILRPGIVVGVGTSPFHSGVGTYNREQHCLGWNRGDNPLPLVLAEDTASAIVACLEKPQSVGRTYNVVGDVRLTARDYSAELAHALDRPLRYHPQSRGKQQLVEIVKWLVKRAIGRRDAPPSYGDLKSRGLVARFDTSDIKSDLGWVPVADRGEFVRRAIEVHATP
jgi:predicted dehydrogenase/nucleoside-diphosphate-sugar epimerase